MIDRLINVFSATILLLSFSVFLFSLKEAYDSVAYEFNISDAKPWEKHNNSMNIFEETYTAEILASAIENAEKANDIDAVKKLRNRYYMSYTESGDRRTRLNSIRWEGSFFNFFIALTFLIAPISINYVRHGEIRLMNRRKGNFYLSAKDREKDTIR